MKRAVAAAAALLFLLWSAGCSPSSKKNHDSSDASSPDSGMTGKNNQAANGTVQPFALAFSSDDSLNPYSSKTSLNYELCTLLYEGLSYLDQTLTAKPQLAYSIEQTSPTALTAVIRSDAKFSDGSPVTADDVAASFSLAKSSDNYKVLVSNINSAKASGKTQVVFNLSSPNPNASACLSFPVIKSGTAGDPVGSGRYMFQGGENPVLNSNPRNPAKPKITAIHLLDVTDPDAMLYALESGSISYYYSDLSGGVIPRTTSVSVSVPLNSLVFLGVNSNRAPLSRPEVRRALSFAVSRNGICASAFAGRARPASTPFHTSWAAISEVKGFEIKENISAAVAQLDLAGYNNKSANGTLSLELLVTEGNSFKEAAADLIRQQLAKAGITLTVTRLPFNKIVERLQTGEFDLYIGEVSLSADMSLSPFFPGGSASYGIKPQCDTQNAYLKYLSGDSTIQQFTDTFVNDMPYIPLCWRDGMAAYNRSLSGAAPAAFDLFYEFQNWEYLTSGSK